MNKQQGFTLLEVIVALTITALALGTVFSLAASSKRLGFTAMQQVEDIVYLRAALNAGLAEPESEYPEFPETLAKSYELEAKELMERPERETGNILYALEPYTIVHGKNGQAAPEVWRWKKLDRVRPRE